MTIRSKRVLAIYNKITSIAQKGSINYLTYYNYIDDLLNNNEYMLIQDVFSKYFQTDIRKWNSIPILKQESWAVILNKTNSTYLARLKDYYDKNNVYQIGPKIYGATNSILLGRFTEVEKVDSVYYAGITYSYDPYYKYYSNTDLYQLSSITYSSVMPGIAADIILQIQLGTSSEVVFINDPTMSLLDKYKAGIQVLLNN